MKKKQMTILMIFLIGGAGVGGFLAGFFSAKFSISSPSWSDASPFTALPTNMTRVRFIIPLGNMDPAGHTFPTGHIYFFVKPGYIDGMQMFAPGNITITKLEKDSYNPPEQNISSDYTISFSIGPYLSGSFAHVNSLSPWLLGQISEFGASGDQINTWQVAGSTATSDSKSVNINTPAGTFIGTSGVSANGFDFTLKDSRISYSWVNQDLGREFQNTVNPLDYFTPLLKTTMLAMLTNYNGNHVVPANYEGMVCYDIAGTAQGIWMRGDFNPSSGARAEDTGLSLVFSNFNATQGAISIGIAGNSSWDQKVYTFTPAFSGNVNQTFSQLVPSGSVNVYFCDGFGHSGSHTEAILLKMQDASHIWLQFVGGGPGVLPNDPTTLWNQNSAIMYDR